MKITRYGEPCPLCRTPLLLGVLQVRSAQSDFPTAERVTRRRCPGCQTTRPEQWTEAMRDGYGDA
ncbi:hypothetical protein ROS62_29355 [Streptomyces sp. DSM 41972]|uniref:Uncharacterized protein n=1 Tax=Streptomyces althioticus subsp. attaecolombicae TaxID=3075534 RepID=A0ABU3I704_9ACTN|nr:hypothetical protein [Streptomyces sp. DSM 41972]SCD35614.1 hypothetical protein GA0115238_105112 [Streptomyces sp. di50b]SCE53106.1 hypothetical protein GA0115245_145913 [Streptomyces sp. di188]